MCTTYHLPCPGHSCAPPAAIHTTLLLSTPLNARYLCALFSLPRLSHSLDRSSVPPTSTHSACHTPRQHISSRIFPHTQVPLQSKGYCRSGGEEKEKAAPRREMERLEHLLSTSYIDLELFWHPLLKCIVWNFLDSVAYSGTGLHLRVQGWLGLVGLLLQLCLAAQRMASPLFRARL